MGTKFSDFMNELNAEASAEGPEAIEEMALLQDKFRIARQLLNARRKLLAILETVRGDSPPWGPKLSPTAYKKLLAEVMLLLEKEGAS